MTARSKTARRLCASLARLRRDERGITIVEGAVAGLLLVAGSLGVLQVFDASTRNNYRAEQSQVVVNRMQSELEGMKALEYGELAMTGNPGTSTDPNNPLSMVSGSTVSVGGVARQMVLNGGTDAAGHTIDAGAVSPGPMPFTSGDVSGEIYRFVVWMPDPSCSACGAQRIKRLIVAVKINDAPASFPRAFQTLHTDVADPETPGTDNPLPPGTQQNPVASFWLTDTPCIFANRQPIEVVSPTDGHPTHNTRGVCSNGKQFGGAAGAPDLMFNESPPLDPDYPPIAQPIYDYATDVEPLDGSNQDKGIILRKPSTNGCITGTVSNLIDFGLLESNRYQKIHKWLSPPIPDGLNVAMLGHGTLRLWTRSINGASYSGKICVYLFVREVSLNLLGIPIYTDVPIVNLDDPLNVGYFTYQQNPWPTNWTEVRIPMHFANTGIVPGRRLGLAITVERANTSGADGMEFMYDHPSFESRLEVETNTLIGF